MEIPELPDSTVGWGMAIAGTLLFIGIAVWRRMTDKRLKHRREKHAAGSKAMNEAQDGAENLENVRDEVDEFLERGED